MHQAAMGGRGSRVPLQRQIRKFTVLARKTVWPYQETDHNDVLGRTVNRHSARPVRGRVREHD